MKDVRLYLLLVATFCFLILAAFIQGTEGATPWPSAVPNFLDPAIQDNWQTVQVTSLAGDPDFPVVMLVRKDAGKPHGLIVVFDARNGTEKWSPKKDPAILFVLSDETEETYLATADSGFLESGVPSGTWITAEGESIQALIGEFLQKHEEAVSPKSKKLRLMV